AATTAVVTARCSPVDTPRSSRPPVHVTFSLPATLFELSATCADHPRRRRSVRRGCRVRRLWQGAGLRQVGLALSPTSQPPVEPEHPDRARARRHLPAEAPQRMHVLPEGGQGHPVVRAARPEKDLRRQRRRTVISAATLLCPGPAALRAASSRS